MDHKTKKAKKRKAQAVHSMRNAPVSVPLPPGMSPHPDFNLFLAMHEVLSLRIAPDCQVRIQFTGIATQPAIRKLIDYLEMALVDFPKYADTSTTQE